MCKAGSNWLITSLPNGHNELQLRERGSICDGANTRYTSLRSEKLLRFWYADSSLSYKYKQAKGIYWRLLLYKCNYIILLHSNNITLDKMSSIYSDFLFNFNESLMYSISFTATHGISVPITDKKRRHSTMKRKIKASFYK